MIINILIHCFIEKIRLFFPVIVHLSLLLYFPQEVIKSISCDNIIIFTISDYCGTYIQVRKEGRIHTVVETIFTDRMTKLEKQM